MRQKLWRLAVYATVSAGLYGITMGSYHSATLAVVSAVKVPDLFLLTLAICLPTLHFIGLLFGSPVRFGQSVAVLMTGIFQTSIFLAAFAPTSLCRPSQPVEVSLSPDDARNNRCIFRGSRVGVGLQQLRRHTQCGQP